MTNHLQTQSENFKRIKEAIEFLENNFKDQPSLDEIASSIHLSKFYFQRLFKEWAGVTPLQFLHFLTIEYAKEQLRKSRSVFDTSLQAGLSSAGRLHDLFITFEAVTPGDYKRLGENLRFDMDFILRLLVNVCWRLQTEGSVRCVSCTLPNDCSYLKNWKQNGRWLNLLNSSKKLKNIFNKSFRKQKAI